MRALVVSIWVFLNLVFFGMCGYMYVLWSQYWMYMDKQTEATTSTYDKQIYFYNRGVLLPTNPNSNYSNKTQSQTSTVKSRMKHSVKSSNHSITYVKNSRPRFPNLQPTDFQLDSNKYRCSADFINKKIKELNDRNNVKKTDSSADNDCDNKTTEFKEKILQEMNKIFTDESNVFKSGQDNSYNVQYRGGWGNFLMKDQKNVLCEMRKVKIKTLKRINVKENPIKDFIPKKGLFQNRKFNSCVIVSSSGALKDSNLGQFIDSHDLVMRFNNAPTSGFEKDVGQKTTVRLLNSQVITKSKFDFLNSNLYKNVTLIGWDPSNYTATIDSWLRQPEYNLFPNYVEARKNKRRFFLLNPTSIWKLWDFLQGNSPSRIRRNPPSSGFLGLNILLPLCQFVDFIEYIPSTRVTKRCHYYESEENAACTFGVWHPLTAEKLLTHYLNSASDFDVFQLGYVRIMGFDSLSFC